MKWIYDKQGNVKQVAAPQTEAEIKAQQDGKFQTETLTGKVAESTGFRKVSGVIKN